MLDATKGLLPARPPLRLPPSSQEPARRSHIHHSNTEPREESLFAFDFCRTCQLTAAESGETSTADATGQ